ncbi:MAG TPA: alpha/beta hydrolase [Ideonella sp.]|nr:alpha/beta hydrolase [Ideonella sp.]
MKPGELDLVQALLEQHRLPVPASLEELRAGVEQLTSSFPAPEGMCFEAVPIAGERLPALQALWGRPRARKARGVLLYLHGGGFMVGSAHGFRGLAGTLAEQAASEVLIVDFRRAPEHPFPAAVEDVAAAYRWLLEQGTPASGIVLAGDSAGAGLVLSALLAARAASLPMPAGALLMSPWVDLSLSGASLGAKQHEDTILAPAQLEHLARAYLGETPATHPLASPLMADLAGLPPLCIQVGSAELLLDDAVRLAGKAGASGVDVRLEIWPGMPHVWHGFAPMLRPGRQAIARGAAFLRERLDGSAPE